jgi:hypothetical protein
MNKKILATLLIAAISVTGLFAASYTATSGNSAILEAKKNDQPYTFIVQYNNTGTGDSATLSSLILETTAATTPEAFTVETGADGNVGKSITFTTTLTTGEFVEAVSGSDATDNTGLYPVIVDDSANVTTMPNPETVTYTAGTAGAFSAASTGSYAVTFNPGKHKAGSEIARFKLQYKGDDVIIAGAYRSTSTINIVSDES